jgi:hypothetical protein
LTGYKTRVDAARVRQPTTVGLPSAKRLKEHSKPGASAAVSELPTTDHPIADEITRIAERAADHIAASVLARLHQHYGEDWVTGVNAHRPLTLKCAAGTCATTGFACRSSATTQQRVAGSKRIAAAVHANSTAWPTRRRIGEP